MPSHFSITHRSGIGKARTGVLKTPHGEIRTPAFMPIATVGAVRHVAPHELRSAGAQIILGNTYHLMLRPGTELLAQRGGLRKFMGWDGPILTDSGGFQIFSLGAKLARSGHGSLVDIDEEGVTFRSHIDGSLHRLTPETAVDHQVRIGSDIAMVLDVCPPQPCTDRSLDAAMERTTRWAERSLMHAEATMSRDKMLMFGIVQGGSDLERRSAHASAICALPFDGFAIGGVAVGEDREAVRKTIAHTGPLLPEDHPRYLMGLGTPGDIVHAVQHGIDLFDCVLPTRAGRHGTAYVWRDIEAFPQGLWYDTVAIARAEFQHDDAPLDSFCSCMACEKFSRAYLRHLTVIDEALGKRLMSIHNLTFYLRLMDRIRGSIARDEFFSS
jgi:queuine tRNA-ribosyltransferase